MIWTTLDRKWRVLAVLAVAWLASCQHPETPTIMTLPPLPETTAGAPPRVNGNVGSPQGLPPAELSYGTPQQASAAGSPGNQGPGDISLDFADTDIRAVVAQILGTILKVNYTIDPAVHGTATLRTDTPLNRSQLLPVLQSLLAENGAALVQSGSLYRVVPIAQAAAVAAAAGTAGAEPVPLRYASAEDLAKVLQPFVGADGKIAADAGRNVLLVSGTPEAREGLISLIHAFDIDVLAGQSYALLPVENGGAKDFANALGDAFHGQKSGPLAGVRVVPMERINAVLVIAANPRSIEQVRRVYQLVERERSRTICSWHVYYLQNSHAEDVAYVLQQAFTPNNVTAQLSARRTSPSGVGGMQGAGGVLGIAGAQGGGYGGGYGGGIGQAGALGAGAGGILGAAAQTAASPLAQAPQAAAQAQSQQLPAAAAPLAGPLSGGATETAGQGLSIIPHPQNNALLIYGTGQETGTIDAMLRKIDILPLQVRIDAVIAEVTLNDNLQYGTQFFFRAGGLNSVLSFASQQNVQSPAQAQLNLNFPGFFIGGHGQGGAPFALNALQ